MKYKKLLREKNGFTLNKKLKQATDLKYVASEEDTELKLNFYNLSNEDIKEVIRLYKNLIEDQKNSYIGAWRDSNKVYFDISHNFESEQAAVQYAKRNNQMAIFDYNNMESVKI